MLNLIIASEEQWDEEHDEFLPPERQYSIQLEHSLISIANWEKKWKKPFLGKSVKTAEENLYYIECMIITPKFDYANLDLLSEANIEEILNYIKDPMTATKINKQNGSNKEIFTSELLYCYMTLYNIPWESQKWHLNRLITLINLCNIKSQPPKKLSQEEIINRNAKLNEERRKQFHSNG